MPRKARRESPGLRLAQRLLPEHQSPEGLEEGVGAAGVGEGSGVEEGAVGASSPPATPFSDLPQAAKAKHMLRTRRSAINLVKVLM